MRVKSEGQRDWMEFYFYYCGRTISTARHYLFHVSDMFAAWWLEQLNCLPVDCGHWFCGSSVVCGAAGCLPIDCVLQEVAGKEEVSGCQARRGLKVSVSRQNRRSDHICPRQRQWRLASPLLENNNICSAGWWTCTKVTPVKTEAC